MGCTYKPSVDDFGTGILKLRNTTACRDGDSHLLRSPSGGHAGEREAGVADQESIDAPGGGRRRPWRKGSWNSVFDSSSRGGLYSGEGGHPYPSTKTHRAVARRGAKGGGAKARAGHLPGKP
jgi:hypothetical protein